MTDSSLSRSDNNCFNSQDLYAQARNLYNLGHYEDAWLNRGTVLAHLNRNEEAIASFTKVIEAIQIMQLLGLTWDELCMRLNVLKKRSQVTQKRLIELRSSDE